jgi:DNA-binding protein HU-beta
LTDSIIEQIDKEIAHLQQARALLISETTTTPTSPTGKKRGRPAGSGKKVSLNSFVFPLAPVKVKRILSEEGKARIAAAQSKRWAASKKAAKKAAKAALETTAAKKTVKKATAKKAVAKKVTAKKAPAKKYVAKKTPAKTAPVTETPASEPIA